MLGTWLLGLFVSVYFSVSIVARSIAEECFLRGKMIAETDVGIFAYFFSGSINLVLIGLSLISVGWGLFDEWRTWKKKKARAAAAYAAAGSN